MKTYNTYKCAAWKRQDISVGNPTILSIKEEHMYSIDREMNLNLCSPLGGACHFLFEWSHFFCSSQAFLMCHANYFQNSFERRTRTYHPIQRKEIQGVVQSWGGAYGFSDLRAARTIGNDQCNASQSGHTLPVMQRSAVYKRGTVGVCKTGSYNIHRGRDGNAESVKLHESPGEGGRGYTAGVEGRENSQSSLGKM